MIERDEDIDNNEPDNMSPEDEKLAERLLITGAAVAMRNLRNQRPNTSHQRQTCRQ